MPVKYIFLTQGFCLFLADFIFYYFIFRITILKFIDFISQQLIRIALTGLRI
ncbi:hypothetical protein D3C87_2120640 [compost metagenome]